MYVILAIILSTILYRVPRGGPGSAVWRRWAGFALGSRVGASVWALWTAGSLTYLAGLPWWVALAGFVYLTLAEMPGYMQWVAGDRIDVRPLTLRGLFLFNPLMGVIYEFCRRHAKKWPTYGPVMDGWTAYAELACGLVTASVFACGLQLLS